jgi:hypothetical protein
MWLLPRKFSPSSRRKGDPISKHINTLAKNKILVMGPETKNDCAGESQQQLTGPGPSSSENFLLAYFSYFERQVGL